ncbi:glycerate kinase type-2 family protein [Deminuibacter soli]|uniref:DUF4147 domain-containing protein n=1 Tax=Deminuibacter soli TaxID=2291815 RepID=A0A3E1ND86_9BACT|nr:DUF4147 domain-containing protein [Deminuibacter soli]RFM25801.1 DUF4147 domain-containing protein [Deminuibacter soli]
MFGKNNSTIQQSNNPAIIPRSDAITIFNAAIAAVQPGRLMQQHLVANGEAVVIAGHVLPRAAFSKLYVIGAGKAAAAMAVAAEAVLGSLITGGLVTTKYAHALPTQKIQVREAAHPVPDESGVQAVRETIQLLSKVTAQDVVLCLISGGASALWCDVPASLTLEAIQTTFDLLIKSGAGIHEINTVRKHLSGIKGGQLLRYCNGARVFSLIISDVPGDAPEVIASGPTVADTTTFHDAYAVLDKYRLLPQLPAAVVQYLQKGLLNEIADTPKPGDVLLQHVVNTIVGSNHLALQAAAAQARLLHYHTHIVPHLVTGETTTAAAELVQMAATYTGIKPICILQGGETTLQVTGNGKGGRNQHFVLAALQQIAVQQLKNVLILSGGTDGTDGPTNAAGAVADTGTLQQAAAKKLRLQQYLHEHDAWHFFDAAGGLLVTGPTQTNVMDIMMALVY